MTDAAKTSNPWAWVPSLYFAQGLPYVVVMTVSVIMYKRLGISNTDIALYTSWLYLPWVIKPLWSPFLELFRTKRFWIVALQFFVGAALACVALTLPAPRFFQYSLAVLWLMAFASATHDIAADGFYMLGLEQHQQAAFSGVRNTFYRIASITGQGLLVMVAGLIEKRTGHIIRAWQAAMLASAAIFLLVAVYHFAVLPYPPEDRPVRRADSRAATDNYMEVFASFFRKQGVLLILAFLLLYRFAEAQLVKLIQPFMLDPRAEGGLGLSTQQVGFAYGTVGVVALLCGGLLGGYLISRRGLRYWLWPMVFAIHLPDLVFVYLSHAQPSHFPLVCGAIAVEQFGYGFGFTAYMLYMIMVAQGEHKTAHYAICTGFMALGMMLPGMLSGWLQDHVGYKHFFIWVMLSTIPGFIVAALVKVDPAFGRKQDRLDRTCPACGRVIDNADGVCASCTTPVPQEA